MNDLAAERAHEVSVGAPQWPERVPIWVIEREPGTSDRADTNTSEPRFRDAPERTALT